MSAAALLSKRADSRDLPNGDTTVPEYVPCFCILLHMSRRNPISWKARRVSLDTSANTAIAGQSLCRQIRSRTHGVILVDVGESPRLGSRTKTHPRKFFSWVIYAPAIAFCCTVFRRYERGLLQRWRWGVVKGV
jgi:hypothetical protein